MIGLVGAHRVGKTTLARAYAEKVGGVFIETPTTAIFKELGYAPAGPFDFKTRLDIQEVILKRFSAIYANAPLDKPVITDRTPLDMLGYTMAEAIGNSVGEEDQNRFAKYTMDCFDVTNRYFSTVVLVQPGIPLVNGDHKGAAQAAPNRAYIEHFNSLALGLTVDPRLKCAHYYIPRINLTIEDRLAALDGACKRTVDAVNQQLFAARLENRRTH